MPDPLAGLNPSQRDAVQTLSGPLLVLAGAGTGKTRVITVRIANLIRHGTAPERILAVTFTNKAAREMRQRTLELIGAKRRRSGEDRKIPHVSTFHALCVNVLRAEAPVLELKRNFSIYDRGDQEGAARAALRQCRLDAETLKPGELLHWVGRWKNAGLRSGPAKAEAGASDHPQAVPAARAYRHYEQHLRQAGALDFDDLLLTTLELFENHPDALARQQARFEQVLVDEYQDTNAMQLRIVRHLCALHRNICVVGDDDQSIYGWRGAEVKNILSFDRHFPGANVVRLQHNYRCCPNILQLANRLIRWNPVRHPKELLAALPVRDTPRFVRCSDEKDEARQVVRDVERTVAIDEARHKDVAILFRTNEQPRAFEAELRERNIPYRLVGAFSFFDRKEVKDLLSYLKVFANPDDEVGLVRILNVPPRGLGPSVAARMVEVATVRGIPLWQALPDVADAANLSPQARRGVDGLRGLIARFRARLGGEPLDVLTSELIETIGYRKLLERQNADPADFASRWQAVEDLLEIMKRYQSRKTNATLAGFLEDVTLAGSDKEDKEQDAVTLMTLHSAKGLEFPYVYLVGLEEGILPHRRSLEDPDAVAEERRLAYVGITRAKRRLTVTRCAMRTRFGTRYACAASRFLPEMFGKVTPEDMSARDRLSEAPPDRGKSSSTPPTLAQLGISERSAKRGFRNNRYSRGD